MKSRKSIALLGSLILVVALVLPLTAGCGGPAGPTITLGAPLALGYPDGVCARDNLELAITEINDAGGVDVGGTAYYFDLVTLDTRDLEPGVPVSEALLAVENLVLSQGAEFLVGGPIRSEAALAAMDTIYDLANGGNPVVAVWAAGFLSPCFKCRFSGCPPPGDPPCSPLAANYTKYKYCFRAQGGAGPLGTECVELCEKISNDEGLNKEAHVMVQNVAHAVGAIMGTVKPGLEGLGWNVTVDMFPTGTIDFSSELLAANATGVPFLIPWFDMPESANCIKQWYDYQLPMLPVGMVVPAHDSLAWTSFGGKCEYLVNCYPKAGVTPINAQATDYIALYEAEINPAGPGLTWVAPVCYQAVHLLKDAIEDAGTLDVDAVITAMEATNTTGVYGLMQFADHDMVCTQDPATGAITTWTQWVAGARVPVYPTAVATGTVQRPPWGP